MGQTGKEEIKTTMSHTVNDGIQLHAHTSIKLSAYSVIGKSSQKSRAVNSLAIHTIYVWVENWEIDAVMIFFGARGKNKLGPFLRPFLDFWGLLHTSGTFWTVKGPVGSGYNCLDRPSLSSAVNQKLKINQKTARLKFIKTQATLADGFVVW